MIYKVNNKKFTKYILFKMIITFSITFALIFILYPLFDEGNRIGVSLLIEYMISIFAFFIVFVERKSVIIKEDKSIIYNHHFNESQSGGINDVIEHVNKKYIIYRVDDIKITPMHINVSSKINAPKNRLKILRVFEKEEEIIASLQELKKSKI